MWTPCAPYLCRPRQWGPSPLRSAVGARHTQKVKGIPQFTAGCQVNTELYWVGRGAKYGTPNPAGSTSKDEANWWCSLLQLSGQLAVSEEMKSNSTGSMNGGHRAVVVTECHRMAVNFNSCPFNVITTVERKDSYWRICTVRVCRFNFALYSAPPRDEEN